MKDEDLRTLQVLPTVHKNFLNTKQGFAEIFVIFILLCSELEELKLNISLSSEHTKTCLENSYLCFSLLDSLKFCFWQTLDNLKLLRETLSLLEKLHCNYLANIQTFISYKYTTYPGYVGLMKQNDKYSVLYFLKESV